jgi:D-glycero-alpha-D-manno-heptose-7-phosphate kinase
MIISKTPLRMSFVGGGSDLAVFYHKYGGAVVSTAINKFVYVTVNPKFDERIRVSYSKTEEARSVDKIKHPLVREAMRMLGIRGGIEITSIADIPAKGTGLGSSSSFTVGLLNALHAYAHQHASAEQLARESCAIEIERCGEPIGKQDQYAAAFGGFNFVRFNPDDSVSVEPIICRRETMRQLEANTLVFYTAITRSASTLLRTQQRAVASQKAKQKAMKRMVELALQLRTELQQNNIDACGEIIHENWLLKRGLTAEVSSTAIDQ